MQIHYLTLNLPLLFLLLIFNHTHLQTLHYVQEISRHGARTPISSAYDPFHTDWGNLELG